MISIDEFINFIDLPSMVVAIIVAIMAPLFVVFNPQRKINEKRRMLESIKAHLDVLAELNPQEIQLYKSKYAEILDREFSDEDYLNEVTTKPSYVYAELGLMLLCAGFIPLGAVFGSFELYATEGITLGQIALLSFLLFLLAGAFLVTALKVLDDWSDGSPFWWCCIKGGVLGGVLSFGVLIIF